MKEPILKFGIAAVATAAGVGLAPTHADARHNWCNSSYMPWGAFTAGCSALGPTGASDCGTAYGPRIRGDGNGECSELRMQSVDADSVDKVIGLAGDADERPAAFASCYLSAMANYCPDEVADGVSGECASSITVEADYQDCSQ